MYLAFRNEKRNQERFDDQLKQSQEVACANLKPLLTIHTQTYVDSKGVSLINGGIGTAVITDIKFEKGKSTTNSLVDLFDLDNDFNWDTYWRFSGNNYYLRAGDKYQLVKLTIRNLIDQGWSNNESKEILLRWQDQKTGVRICVKYSDILGNTMETYCQTLK